MARTKTYASLVLETFRKIIILALTCLVLICFYVSAALLRTLIKWVMPCLNNVFMWIHFKISGSSVEDRDFTPLPVNPLQGLKEDVSALVDWVGKNSLYK